MGAIPACQAQHAVVTAVWGCRPLRGGRPQRAVRCGVGAHLVQAEAVAHDVPGGRRQAVQRQCPLRQVRQLHLPPQMPQHRGPRPQALRPSQHPGLCRSCTPCVRACPAHCLGADAVPRLRQLAAARAPSWLRCRHCRCSIRQAGPPAAPGVSMAHRRCNPADGATSAHCAQPLLLHCATPPRRLLHRHSDCFAALLWLSLVLSWSARRDVLDVVFKVAVLITNVLLSPCLCC